MWLTGTLFLYSVGKIEKREDLPIANFIWDQHTKQLWYFNLAAFLWIIAFLLCLGDFVIGVSCSIWYFTQGTLNIGQENETEYTEKDIKNAKRKTRYCCPVITGYCWGLGYHLGSIALGAFIIAFIWSLRITMGYLHRRLADVGLTKNKVVNVFINSVHCFLACFERFIRFVNKQAFIYVSSCSNTIITYNRSSRDPLLAYL